MWSERALLGILQAMGSKVRCIDNFLGRGIAVEGLLLRKVHLVLCCFSFGCFVFGCQYRRRRASE